MCGHVHREYDPALVIRSTFFTPPPTRPPSPSQLNTPSTPTLGLGDDLGDEDFSPDSPLSPTAPSLGPRGDVPPTEEKLASDLLMELQIVAFAENGIGSALDSL
jgi:hypothetical protein